MKETLISMIDPIASLQIEAVLSSFDGYPLPKWIRSRSVDEYMFEWWSVQPYYNDYDRKFLLFTYHKVERRLEAYYDILTGENKRTFN